jgi:hypothetical protein
MFRRVNETYRDHRVAATPGTHATGSISSFRDCDLDTGFADAFAGEQCDCSTACQVAQHLDHPRECRKLLRWGRVVVVSTPNIWLFEGRIKFALTGELRGFVARSYRSERHISPVPAGEFR